MPVRTRASVCLQARVGPRNRVPAPSRVWCSGCCRTRLANVCAGLGYALLSDLVAQAASQAGRACADGGAEAGAPAGRRGKTHDRELDPSVSWHCALSRLNVDDCKDAAHAALSVFLHSVQDPDADIVARIVERSPDRLLCVIPPACVPSGAAGCLPGDYRLLLGLGTPVSRGKCRRAAGGGPVQVTLCDSMCRTLLMLSCQPRGQTDTCTAI